MSEHAQPSGEIFLVRHGQTEWSVSGRHTGLTDLPLTDDGRKEAGRIGQVLSRFDFDRVFSSPLERARRTCELAGFGERMEVEPDLVEWNYGEYEGLKREEIAQRAGPDWGVFTHGCAGGESPSQIAARIDRLIAKLRRLDGRLLLFAHGHVLRVLGTRWMGAPVSLGQHLLLDTATLSVLTYYRGTPALKHWNAAMDISARG